MSIDVNVRSGQSEKMILQIGDILIVRSKSNYVSGIVRDPLNRIATVSANSTIAIGPFKTVQKFSIEADPNSVHGEPLIYSVGNHFVPSDAAQVDFGDASPLRTGKSFNSSFTLDGTYNGTDLYCDATSNVTVTVPANLPLNFDVRFIVYSTGNITISAGSGATNRDGQTTLSGLGKSGTLTISRQSPKNDAAQYALSGGFV